jgi:hypothetical protein
MRLTLLAMLGAHMLLGGQPGKTGAGMVSTVQPQGSHGLRNEKYGLMLRPRDASNKDGEPIVLYPDQPWKCMAWHFEAKDAGVRLVNYFTSKSFVVDRAGGGRALVQQPSSSEKQPQETLHFIDLGDGLYEIEAPGGGGVLSGIDSDGHGDLRVVVAPWTKAASQMWRLVDLPDHFTM